MMLCEKCGRHQPDFGGNYGIAPGFLCGCHLNLNSLFARNPDPSYWQQHFPKMTPSRPMFYDDPV